MQQKMAKGASFSFAALQLVAQQVYHLL